ncbi:hypothetical protein ACLM49_01375 [Enterococcus faecium]|uniref:hypothetical protein n=1 Tax=Enterococcus faecium TaxID=1352 RepID=UPI000CF08D85|nr:hypothetical protein [Enterococcus faecium]EGP5399081.1 hypothetical protein [Enterococcus faecium]EGP5630278.1 hypothetical protein [Enterococcus faecium]MBS6010447.1 hypothetical protein [Enterococcus faecium]PQC82838.1 hypothetical protein CUM69_00820 [Enterococcus faecium]
MAVLLSDFECGRIFFSSDAKRILKKVIRKMRNEQIDIEGWTLDERPLDTIFCFYHPESKQAFDILVTDQSEITPYYSGEETAKGINSFPVVTINEAIQNYIIE